MLNEIRKTLVPPYSGKDLYSIFLALFIMFSLPLTVLQVTSSRELSSTAATKNSVIHDNSIQVEILSQENDQVVSGTQTIKIQAYAQNKSVLQVNLFLNNRLLSTVNNPSSTENFTTTISWDTTKESNGAKTLTATAVTDLGTQNRSKTITVKVENSDVQSPIISFENLSDGDYISGNTYKLIIKATDNTGIKNVLVYFDNVELSKLNKLPFNLQIDLSSIPPGNHSIKAVATDFVGNSSETSATFYKGIKKQD